MEERQEPAWRRLRWGGAVLAGCSLCAALGTAVPGGGGEQGASALLAQLPALGRLQALHWENHEFRRVPAAARPLTPLEKADAAAEKQAQTAAHWGTLAATKDVFRSKEFEEQLRQMKQNAELSEGTAQKLDDQIQYEGKLLQVGRKGTSSIIARAAMAARDASYLSDPAEKTARDEVLSEHLDALGRGSRFRNHEFVRVFPKPFRYAAGAPQQEQTHSAMKTDERAFLGQVNHEMHMKKLATALKLDDKPPSADSEKTAKSGESDDVLKSRADMDNGVDPAVPAAAAKRLAQERAAAMAHGSTNLAAPAKASTDKGVLDNKGDMDNGVDTAAMQKAAKNLAETLVDKMHKSAATAAKTELQKKEDAKKQADEHEKEVVKARQDWAKANPDDDAKVAELKKELWRAEAAEGNSKGKVQSMKEVDSKGKTAAGDKAKEDAKKQAKEHEKEVVEARQDWAKANPDDDAKVAELKKELWRAEAKAEPHPVVAMKQSDSKTKTAAGDKAKEEEAKKQAEEHEKEVVKARQDWAKANPDDDAKVAELKKELWRAEAAEDKGHTKVATARTASAKGVKSAASAGRSIETSGAKARGKLIAAAMKSAVTNAVSAVVDEMSAKTAVKKAATEASKVVKKANSARQIEAMAKSIEAASSALLLAGSEHGDDAKPGENDIIARQLRHQILQAQRDEQSHKNAAQLLQAQAIAVRQNAVMEAAHEAALDYPGATLSEPRQEAYL